MSEASALIDGRIAELGDWRGRCWRGCGGWFWRRMKGWWRSGSGGGCRFGVVGGLFVRGRVIKTVVKLTFAKGAKVEDPAGLFNSSLEGNVRRAIDLSEGVELDEVALGELVRAAVRVNRMGKKK